MRPETVPKYAMNVGNAGRLGVFAATHRFFTPALPYLFGRFTDAVLADFLGQYKKPCPIAHRHFARPVFHGMTAPDGDGEWNHVLWCVEAEAYPALEAHLLSAVTVDHAHQTLYRIGAQDVTIPDPLALDRGSPAPHALDVVVFGVDASAAAYSVRPPHDPPLWSSARYLPCVVRHPPRTATVALSRAVFDGGGPADVAAAVDALPHRGESVTHPMEHGDVRMGDDVPGRDRLLAELAAYKKENP